MRHELPRDRAVEQLQLLCIDSKELIHEEGGFGRSEEDAVDDEPTEEGAYHHRDTNCDKAAQYRPAELLEMIEERHLGKLLLRLGRVSCCAIAVQGVVG